MHFAAVEGKNKTAAGLCAAAVDQTIETGINGNQTHYNKEQSRHRLGCGISLQASLTYSLSLFARLLSIFVDLAKV